MKSFDAVVVPEARVLPGGGLEHDRRWALVDQEGAFLTGKRTALVHRIRSRFDLEAGRISVEVEGQERSFSLVRETAAFEAWCSEHFSLPLRLIENRETGFPDDTDASGPTIVSTATLEQVADWFRLPLEEVRRRFRTCLEVGGVEPFWEDRLYGPPGEGAALDLGPVRLIGVNPCQRCAVPTRDSQTGDATAGFAKTFSQHREQALPPWANRSRFDHHYRLATNTKTVQGGLLRVGDEAILV